MTAGWIRFALAALGGLSLLITGAVWQKTALQSAFASGETAGRAAAEMQARHIMAEQERVAHVTAQLARVQASELERSHALMQRRYEELIDDVDAHVVRQGSAPGDCLAAGVVRGLDATGRRGGASAGSP